MRTHRRTADIWPGFVDGISTLLLVLVFLLAIFMLSEFFLGRMLSGRDRELEALNLQVAELAELLSFERSENETLSSTVDRLSVALQDTAATEEGLRRDLETLAGIESDLARSEERAGDLEEERSSLEARLQEMLAAASAARVRLLAAEDDLEAERELSDAARAQAALLNRQLADLRARLASLNAALEQAEEEAADREIQIANLGSRLNAALATRVNELARYRSDFFGRLRAVLGERSDVRIVGDRFVFQSEVLFASGSAQIGPAGQAEIRNLSRVLLEVARRIPGDVPWVLQVEGHTDPQPIMTDEFPSNWELSLARANAVARLLRENGVPPDRLSVAGFAEYQPIVAGSTPEAYRRNRRIELKLTQPLHSSDAREPDSSAVVPR